MKLNSRTNIVTGTTLALLNGASIVGYAQDAPGFYETDAATRFYLGAGMSPNDLNEGKEQAIKTPLVTAMSSEGAHATKLSARLVRNSRELKTELGISTRIDASSLFASGGATFKYGAADYMRSEDMHFVLTARTNFGQRYIVAPALTATATSLQRSDRAGFERRYGSRYISGVQLGVSVSAIITLRNVDAETRSALYTQIQGGGSFIIASMDASATFRKAMKEAINNGSIDVEVVATGGNGIQDLSNLIRTMVAGGDTMTNTVNEIANYVSRFNLGNAAPIGYWTTLYPSQTLDFFNQVRDQRLQETVTLFRSLQSGLEDMQMLLDGTDPSAYLLTNNQRVALATQVGLYQQYQGTLAAFHQNLKATKTFPASGVPALPAAPRGMLSIEAMHNAGYWPIPTVRVFDNLATAIDYGSNPSGGFQFGGTGDNGSFELWPAFDPEGGNWAGVWGKKYPNAPQVNRFLAGNNLYGTVFKTSDASDAGGGCILRWKAPVSGWWKISYRVRGGDPYDALGRSMVHLIAGGTTHRSIATPTTGSTSEFQTKVIYLRTNQPVDFWVEALRASNGRHAQANGWIRTLIEWDH